MHVITWLSFFSAFFFLNCFYWWYQWLKVTSSQFFGGQWHQKRLSFETKPHCFLSVCRDMTVPTNRIYGAKYLGNWYLMYFGVPIYFVYTGVHIYFVHFSVPIYSVHPGIPFYFVHFGVPFYFVHPSIPTYFVHFGVPIYFVHSGVLIYFGIVIYFVHFGIPIYFMHTILLCAFWHTNLFCSLMQLLFKFSFFSRFFFLFCIS